MSAVADILDRAADLIEPEGAWIQGVLGRDAKGDVVMTLNLDLAVCFCALGALERAKVGPRSDREYDVLLSVIQAPTVAEWNDAPERTQSEVVAAFRKAAALTRGEQP